MKISEKVCQLMSDQGCGVLPFQDIQHDRVLYDIGFDSLRYMELIVLLEEEFNITFPDEMLEITSETVVQEIIVTVEACLNL